MTAGNSSPLNDGASAVLLGSPAAQQLVGLPPLARIAGRGAAANAALNRSGLGWGEVDAVELNEAFAAQSVACINAWGVDPGIVNAHGGAIAIGHPLGASGTRVLGTLAWSLQASGPRPFNRERGYERFLASRPSSWRSSR